MAVSVNQTLAFWDRKAREMPGYTAERLVGAKCSEIPSGLGRSGLTPECAGCCACMRYARAGLAPPVVGTVVTCLFRERVTDVAQPVGNGAKVGYAFILVVLALAGALLLFNCVPD